MTATTRLGSILISRCIERTARKMACGVMDSRARISRKCGEIGMIAVNATDTTQQATLRWGGKTTRIELMPSEVKLFP